MPIVPLTCLTCGLTFSTVGLMGMHCLTVKHVRLPFCCFRCGVGFSDEASMKEHTEGGHVMPIADSSVVNNSLSPDGSDPATTTPEGVPLAVPVPISSGLATKTAASAKITVLSCNAHGCNASFSDEGQLLHHKATTRGVGHFFCLLCSSSFEKLTNLNKHQLQEAHLQRCKICPFCHKSFHSPAHTAFHIIGSGECPDKATTSLVRELAVAQIKTWGDRCYVCNDVFPKKQLTQHLLEKSHFDSGKTCPFCPRKFNIPDQTADHVTKGECRAAVAHEVWSTTREQLKACKIYCSQCAAGFTNEAMLYQHYATSALHFWCFVCSKHHRSANGLSAHLQSTQHALSGKSCPFCSRGLGSPSSVAQHLSNKHQCPAFQNGSVNEYVMGVATAQVMPPSQTFDPASTSTSTTSSSHSPSQVVSSTSSTLQSSGSGDTLKSTSTVQYTANKSSFNGQAYICFLCQKGFKTIDGLNSHLQSSIHKKSGDEFSCPKCNKTFRELSGMVQHIESGSCGFTMPRQVIEHVRELTQQYSQQRLTL